MNIIVWKAMCGLIILLASISFSKEVTITGIVNDTVLVINSGMDPVLSVYPAQDIMVSIFAGGIEEERDCYFARTDSDGNFTVKVNLPDTCKYGRYYISVACTTSSKNKLNQSYTMPDDSLFNSVKVNFMRSPEYSRDSIKDRSYSHYFTYIGGPILNSGDTLQPTITTMCMVNDPDTLKYPGCAGLVSLVTSSGNVVYEHPIGCAFGQYVYISQMGAYRPEYLDVIIPKDLQKEHSDFREDRILKLIYKMNSISDEIVKAFTVIDSGVKVINATTIQNRHRINSNGSWASLSINSNRIFLNIGKSGKYTLELFTPNGKLIQSIAQNQHFESGKHTLAMNETDVKSPQMIVARLNGDGVKAATFIFNK